MNYKKTFIIITIAFLSFIGSVTVASAKVKTKVAPVYSINIDVIENIINKYYPQLKENAILSSKTVMDIIKTRYYDPTIYKIPYNFCKADSNGDGVYEKWVGVYPNADTGTVMLKFAALSKATKFQYWGVDAVRNSLGNTNNPPHPILMTPVNNLYGLRLVILEDPKLNNDPKDDKAEAKLIIQDAMFGADKVNITKLPTCDKI